MYDWTDERPFQALALTGGGYRGLFTAQALSIIEAELGEPIGRRFDLVCGTSIGGIVALAVAFEVPMAKVVEVFTNKGEEIFPPERCSAYARFAPLDLLKNLKKPRYESAPLRDAIKALIPEDALLGDALHPVCIPTVNVSQGISQILKTRHKKEWSRDWKFKAVDVALATSAAPTFFELAEIGNDLFADGGLFANAPDLVALHEAETFFDVSAKQFRLLSIGTTTQGYAISHTSGRDFGILDWMKDQRLFSVMISAQQQFVDQIVKHRLQDRYVRIDHEPTDESVRDLGLDVASKAAQRTLKGLAEKLVTNILGTELQPFLKHQPQLKIFRGE
ncbi:Patatin-like phospholipase [compost metagenome]